jgi:hypothetical protein
MMEDVRAQYPGDAQPPRARPAEALTDPFRAIEEMFRLMVSATAPAVDRRAVSDPSPGALGAVPPALGVVGQVGGAFMASGLRYWSRLAEVWMRVLPTLYAAAAQGPAADGDGAAALGDDLRAALRELAELPCQESRRLQAELDRIVSPGATAAPDPDAPYWRRWDAKP